MVERDWDVNAEHFAALTPLVALKSFLCCWSVPIVCFGGGFARYLSLIVLHIRKYSFTFILFFSQEAEEHLEVKALVLETLHRCCQTLPANHVKHRQHLENSFYGLFCYSPFENATD